MEKWKISLLLASFTVKIKMKRRENISCMDWFLTVTALSKLQRSSIVSPRPNPPIQKPASNLATKRLVQRLYDVFF
jgi:hypothetical protein